MDPTPAVMRELRKERKTTPFNIVTYASQFQFVDELNVTVMR